MTSAAWHPVGIVVDPSDPHWRKHLQALASRLPQMEVHRVVSFCDPAVGVALRSGWPAAVHWRDLVPAALNDKLWRTAYGKVRALIDGLKAHGQGTLKCYLHVLSDALMRHYVWDYLAQTSRPAVVLLPPNSELRKRVGAPCHTQGWMARLAGGRRNLARLSGWFWRARPQAGAQPVESAVSGILMLVEDGVSAVHRLPALAVARELHGRGYPPRIVTSTASIASSFASQGHPVSVVKPRSIVRFAWKALRQAVPDWLDIVRQMHRPTLKDPLPPEFVAWLRTGTFGYLLRRMLLVEAITQAESTHAVEMVLALGETSPLVIVGLDWANHRGISNAAVTPVLIGGRPDNEDFPAAAHLVYGEQAAEWMRRMGVDADSIRVVGSTTYEAALDRDRTADIERTRCVLPAWQPSQRLVVLATEALPVPETELVPMLQACLALDDVHAVVKLHPADAIDAFTRIISEQAFDDKRVSLLTTCDLEALLHAADLLVCVQSNIAITAAILGTPTLSPTFGGRERPVDITTGGFATECAAADSAQELIDSLTRSGTDRQGALDRMHKGVRHFAGRADGRSHVHIADAVLELMNQQCLAKLGPT